jgi:hypothetical protein
MNSQSALMSRINPRLSEVKRAAIRESVASGAALNGSYLAMNLAAALIAGFGLMENSPAVIIGAMLIAMLYGPIIGIALGLARQTCTCSAAPFFRNSLRDGIHPGI